MHSFHIHEGLRGGKAEEVRSSVRQLPDGFASCWLCTRSDAPAPPPSHVPAEGELWINGLKITRRCSLTSARALFVKPCVLRFHSGRTSQVVGNLRKGTTGGIARMNHFVYGVPESLLKW